MSRRADTSRSRLGAAIAVVASSIVGFFAAVTFVFLVLVWGQSGDSMWGVALGVLLPIGMTVISALLLTGHLVRRRLARAAAIDQELKAMLRTDLR